MDVATYPAFTDTGVRKIASRMRTIDPEARSFMSMDLMQNRATEMGEVHGIALPLTRRLITLISEAEAAAAGQPNLQATDLAFASPSR